MFKFLKKDPLRSLNKKYEKIMEEAFLLSRTNRRMADKKYAEAEKVREQIEVLQAAK